MITEFVPDLVIETTSVCDRACIGCYAPNVVTSETKSNLLETNPEFFLAPSALKNALDKLDHSASLQTLALRGGEPSRHPLLHELIEIAAARCSNVILETHARWILEASAETDSLLQVCKDQNVQIKISFDHMHGLATDKLKEIWNSLHARGIEILVAITEASDSEFQKTRSLCNWIPDGQIIFQRKATSDEELVRPRIGVINRRGQLSVRMISRLGSKHSAAGVA